MAHETRCQGLASSTGRSRCAHDGEFLDLFPAKALSVVEPIVVDQLAKQLDGRLGTVDLLLRHVDVVDEDDALRIALHAPDLLTLSHKLSFNVGLGASALSLRGEVELDRYDRGTVVGTQVLYELLHYHRLACSGGTSHKDRLVNRGSHLK